MKLSNIKSFFKVKDFRMQQQLNSDGEPTGWYSYWDVKSQQRLMVHREHLDLLRSGEFELISEPDSNVKNGTMLIVRPLFPDSTGDATDPRTILF